MRPRDPYMDNGNHVSKAKINRLKAKLFSGLRPVTGTQSVGRMAAVRKEQLTTFQKRDSFRFSCSLVGTAGFAAQQFGHVVWEKEVVVQGGWVGCRMGGGSGCEEREVELYGRRLTI